MFVENYISFDRYLNILLIFCQFFIHSIFYENLFIPQIIHSRKIFLFIQIDFELFNGWFLCVSSDGGGSMWGQCGWVNVTQSNFPLNGPLHNEHLA